MARASETERLKQKLMEREALEIEIRDLQIKERERQRDQERRTYEAAGRVALAFFRRNPEHQVSRELVQQVTDEVKRMAERDLFEALSLVHKAISPDTPLSVDDVQLPLAAGTESMGLSPRSGPRFSIPPE